MTKEIKEGMMYAVSESPDDITDPIDPPPDIIDLILEPLPSPEPTTMLLFGSGLIGLAGFKRKFKK